MQPVLLFCCLSVGRLCAEVGGGPLFASSQLRPQYQQVDAGPRGDFATRMIQQSPCKVSLLVNRLQQAEFGLAEKRGEMR